MHMPEDASLADGAVVAEHAAAHWTYAPHGHSCYELMLLRQGHCAYEIGNFRDGCQGPTAILLGPGLRHSFFTDGKRPGDEFQQSYSFWFRSEFVPSLPPPLQCELEPLLELGRYGLQFDAQSVRGCEALLPDPTMRSAAARVGALLAVLGRLAGARHWQLSSDHGSLPQAQLPPPNAGRHLQRARAVVAYLQAEHHRPLTLAGCAAHFQMSVSAFQDLLKRYQRGTFLQILNSIRVAAVQADLRHSDQPITDIALAHGFDSLSTFNRRFKTLVGLNPRAYRQKWHWR
jgi:AraC-like DNA-binding protein